MKNTGGHFIPHCDGPDCCFGSFQYKCPCCSKECTDFNVWWEMDNIVTEGPHKFKCNECSENLIVQYNKKSYSFFVTKDV